VDLIRRCGWWKCFWYISLSRTRVKLYQQCSLVNFASLHTKLKYANWNHILNVCIFYIVFQST